jgi:hypothetical protein
MFVTPKTSVNAESYKHHHGRGGSMKKTRSADGRDAVK